MYNRQGVVQSIYMREVSASEIRKMILELKNKSCHKTVYSDGIMKVFVDFVAGPAAINIVNKSI